MKKVLLGVLFLAIIYLVACSNDEESTTQEEENQESEVHQEEVVNQEKEDITSDNTEEVEQAVVGLFENIFTGNVSDINFYSETQKEEYSKVDLGYNPVSAKEDGYSFKFDENLFAYHQIDDLVKFAFGYEVIKPNGEVLGYAQASGSFIEVDNEYKFVAIPSIISSDYDKLEDEIINEFNNMNSDSEYSEYREWALNTFNGARKDELNAFINKY
ncbi:hypothetical protein [Salinibacillus xinjiangensis]|uniref:Uncharacterized protein n=1 Tax=Salinibacillus xinjiangensis TaxID=1229268 RepID=A0A6G1XBI1_9BACI|nr:hypothetical protein [Salinibacillus xinjiangensis]MRG88292.1 hypothetical protein [Salinibacillus xinjiangensis]